MATVLVWADGSGGNSVVEGSGGNSVADSKAGINLFITRGTLKTFPERVEEGEEEGGGATGRIGKQGGELGMNTDGREDDCEYGYGDLEKRNTVLENAQENAMETLLWKLWGQGD
jgi:hypothetical protein